MRRKLPLLLAVPLLAAILGVGARAATVWNVDYVPQYPMSVALPASWDTLGLEGQEAFDAGNNATATYLMVYLNHGEKSQAAYFAGLQVDARKNYLEQDPKAIIRVRTVELPAGKALEVIAELTRHLSGTSFRVWIQNYNLFYRGVGYDVQYIAPPSETAVDLPVFAASAQSIRFGDGSAVLPSSGPNPA